jgi:uncharacterized protein (DUF983 family)
MIGDKRRLVCANSNCGCETTVEEGIRMSCPRCGHNQFHTRPYGKLEEVEEY